MESLDHLHFYSSSECSYEQETIVLLRVFTVLPCLLHCWQASMKERNSDIICSYSEQHWVEGKMKSICRKKRQKKKDQWQKLLVKSDLCQVTSKKSHKGVYLAVFLWGNSYIQWSPELIDTGSLLKSEETWGSGGRARVRSVLVLNATATVSILKPGLSPYSSGLTTENRPNYYDLW